MRQTIESSNEYETLWEKWDLYIPFIERGYKLLKSNGITSMIVSDAFCHAKYAQKSQKWFLKNSLIIRLDFLSKLQFFDAAVRNIIYFFQKSDGSNNQPKRFLHQTELGDVKLLPTEEQKNLTHRVFFPEDTAKQVFLQQMSKLGDICYISVSMVVNANEKIAQGAFKLEDITSNTKDKLHPKPFVEGKHLSRWIPLTHKWIEWDTNRAPGMFRRPTFPQLYEVDEKILMLRISGKDIRACFDNQKLLCNHTSLVCVPWYSLSGVRNASLKKSARYCDEKPSHSDLPRREELENRSGNFFVKYLLAIMNSTIAYGFLQSERRSNTDIYPDDWKKLPIPKATPEQQKPIIELVDKVLRIKQDNKTDDVSELEAEIDDRVAYLYGLTAEEMKIIRGE